MQLILVASAREHHEERLNVDPRRQVTRIDAQRLRGKLLVVLHADTCSWM